ncbi:MAG: alpha/beta hydrolase, partial [Burkholderiales bacterium]
FPIMVELHGGAWVRGDRQNGNAANEALAKNGVIVAALDFRVPPAAPYPASLADIHCGIRWCKTQAPAWNGRPDRIGAMGTSSGAHQAMLLGMRPRDPRYAALPLAEAPGLDATVNYVATRSPISDPYARVQQAEKMQRAEMVQNTKNWFIPWETIHEANPQEILERREKVSLPPLLIMQGELDDNVLPAVQRKFAETYRKAGGDCRYELFEKSEHEWTGKPGPQTTRAHEMVKAFIARNVNAPEARKPRG